MKLIISNGHIIADVANKKYIVDTGSPISFSYDGISSLETDNDAFSFSSSDLCPKETADQLTGIGISGFIGMDNIRRTGLSIDIENMELEFSNSLGNVDQGDYLPLSFDLFMGQYIVTNDIHLGRKLQNVIIDTGAPISYVSSKLASLFEKSGEMYEDISPNFGVLRGEFLKGELRFAAFAEAKPRMIKVGLMPNELDAFGIFEAILGVTALTNKKIVFDFVQRVIFIKN